ncbi:MAG: PD40 domain-containing protein [Planctomycetes bacterium]|nr:PD40 domain-containing protein [Planctomycetota bacterium]
MSPQLRVSTSRFPFVPLACAFLAGVAAAQEDTTQRMSVRESGAQAAGISRAAATTAEGRVILFQSLARNLVVGDTNGVQDVFLRRRRAPETTVRLSVSSSGAQGNGVSSEPAISATGRHAVFTSRATNLIPNDFNFVADVFLRDRTLETTVRVSVGQGDVEGDDNAGWPSISSDGRYVAFQSTADNLVPGDVFGCGGAHPCALGMDVFVRDRTLGTTTRVSTFDGGGTFGVPGLGSKPSIAANGAFIAFESDAALVAGDANGAADVYVKNLGTGTIVRASTTTGPNTLAKHALSGDGMRVVWRDGGGQIWMRDLALNTQTRISQFNGNPASAVCSDATISDDGGWAAFVTRATNFPPIGTARARVFYADLQTGEIVNASIDTFGVIANGDCAAPALNANGRWVAYSSEASNLIEGDNNSAEDVFLRDRETPIAFRYCEGNGTGGVCPCGNYGLRGRGCENSFATGGTRLFADGTPSIGTDTLTLSVIDFGPETFAILLQADAQVPSGVGTAFGDGLQCLAGNVVILGARQATLGVCAFGQDAGDPPLSITGALPPLGGTYYYQALYRHGQPFCTPAEFNTTNGLRIPWTP